MSFEHMCVFDWRYGSSEMRDLFKAENIVKTYIRVEQALLKGLEEAGLAPRGCSELASSCMNSVTARDVYEMEKVIGHDIASLVFKLEEVCGECGRFIHLGATSYDIVDTAWALILRDALRILKIKMRNVVSTLIDLSRRYVDVVVVGRTHGQHAAPVTMGFKFANYAYELARSYERISEAEKRVLRLKISGSVGTMASWGDRGFVIERTMEKELGLQAHLITTQVAPRDGFAELASVLAILASQLDRLALEIRELSRSEIGEVYESMQRVGSSAMPHKRNPVIAERISGLARIARGFVTPALENIPLMHERDLTNSSSERVLLPHLFLLIDQMLMDTIKLLSVVKVDEEAARRNLELSRGAIYSEILLTKLIEKGWSRRRAYFKVREVVESIKPGETLIDSVLRDPELSSMFNREELVEFLNPSYATRSVRGIVERALRYVEELLNR
jgi:adenylosuccinate lyase